MLFHTKYTIAAVKSPKTPKMGVLGPALYVLEETVKKKLVIFVECYYKKHVIKWGLVESLQCVLLNKLSVFQTPMQKLFP